MDALTLITLALSTARLTRLVTDDFITEPLRTLVIRRMGETSKISYLILCTWCMSIWVGTAVIGVWHVWGGTTAFQLITLALSASYIAGYLNSKVED